jgi:hypothetical protein
MPRELTLHPESGQLVEVVHSYQNVELQVLRDEVASKEQALTEVQARLEAKQAELQTVSLELAQAEGALEDSKSTLTRGSELVGAPAEGVDTGADAAGSESPAESAEGANF